MKLDRAKSWEEKWSSPTVIMSDLHINGSDRDQAIIDTLLWITDSQRERGESKERSNDPSKEREESFPLVKRIILLGDVFDFQLAYSEVIFKAHLPFLSCLRTLRGRGVELIMFTGNHDPEAHPAFTQDLEIAVCERATLFTLYGERVRCEHGDLLEPKLIKRSLCRAVRSPLILWLAKCIPAQLLWTLTQRWGAKAVGGADAYHSQQGSLTAVIESAWPQLAEQGIERWVFGHFHQVISWSPVDSSLPRVFVTGDQVISHTLLLWTENGPAMYQLNTLPPLLINIR